MGKITLGRERIQALRHKGTKTQRKLQGNVNMLRVFPLAFMLNFVRYLPDG